MLKTLFAFLFGTLFGITATATAAATIIVLVNDEEYDAFAEIFRQIRNV